jgi:uncharacterized protein
MNFPAQLQDVIAAQPYPLLFVSLSGAHLYGFPSPDSDFDLRGAHAAPLREVLSLKSTLETVEVDDKSTPVEIDLVTHEVKMYFELLLKKNGNMLEQVYSPLVLATSPEHDELRAIAKTCITRYHAQHYLGLAKTQWGLFNKENPRRVKPLLYVYRALLSGLYLMQTGEPEANLVTLNETYRLPYIPDLVARKTGTAERATLPDTDYALHQAEYARLRAELEAAFASSRLPELPSGADALNDLLLRIRFAQPSAPA